MAELFRRAEAMGGQVVDAHDLDEVTLTLSRQLYYMLVMLTTDDAQRLIGNVEQGNGAEAWRRLCWEYEPDVRVRHGAVLHALLRREFGKDPNSDLAVEIESFERDVRRYEEQSGKVLDQDVKISVLIGGMLNVKVRDHLELNAARLDTYQQLRAEILNFAVAKRTWTQDVDDPMVIGAVKDGKGKTSKGKGKDSKGKGKDSKGKAKSKDNANPNAGKDCHYCGKPNHIKQDCRKLKADIKAGKVDSSGKPLPGAGARSVTEEARGGAGGAAAGAAGSSSASTQLALPAPGVPMPMNAAYPTLFHPMWYPGQGGAPPAHGIHSIRPPGTVVMGLGPVPPAALPVPPAVLPQGSGAASSFSPDEPWTIH